MPKKKVNEWFEFDGEYRPTNILQARMATGARASITRKRVNKRYKYTPRVSVGGVNHVGQETTSLDKAEYGAISMLKALKAITMPEPVRGEDDAV